jgi:hypothetical protein
VEASESLGHNLMQPRNGNYPMPTRSPAGCLPGITPPWASTSPLQTQVIDEVVKAAEDFGVKLIV